jgi:RNA polymerase sigma factor (TIGR02999 family)
MASDNSEALQNFLTRAAQGDEGARHELIALAYERLRRLARVILNEDFPRLKASPACLQTTDVADEAALGMYQALSEIQLATPRDFFRLAAQRIRWLLLNRARQIDRARRELLENRPPREAGEPPEGDAAAALDALYRQIDALPEKEREVVDLLYFHGFSQRDAALLLGVAERSVRRYWAAARVKLMQGLEGQVFVRGSIQHE